MTTDTEDLLWRRFNEWFRARRPDYPSEWDAYQAGHAAAKAEHADVGGPVAFAHFAENGNIRLWAPERPRDLDGNAAHPLYTADQLAAAVAQERERAATVVDEKIGSVRKANPGRGGRINSAVAFALDSLGYCADAIRAGAPTDTLREAGAVAGGAA